MPLLHLTLDTQVEAAWKAELNEKLPLVWIKCNPHASTVHGSDRGGASDGGGGGPVSSASGLSFWEHLRHLFDCRAELAGIAPHACLAAAGMVGVQVGVDHSVG